MVARLFVRPSDSPRGEGGHLATEERGVISCMANQKIAMELDKKIALVAHDNKKQDLVE